jgi:hypothetical protein
MDWMNLLKLAGHAELSPRPVSPAAPRQPAPAPAPAKPLKRLFISGPYRAKIHAGIDQNIRAAKEVADQVATLGIIPVTPHLLFAHMDGLASDEWFLQVGLELLDCCHGISLHGNWQRSVGAKAELERAKYTGTPIFFYEWPDWVDRLCWWRDGKKDWEDYR